jgi:hypothetical protein
MPWLYQKGEAERQLDAHQALKSHLSTRARLLLRKRKKKGVGGDMGKGKGGVLKELSERTRRARSPRLLAVDIVHC